MADNQLRLKNLFEGTNVGENRDPYGNLFPPGPMPVVEPANDISQLRTYAPETEALNRFNARLQEFPEHQPAKFGDKVTAGLMGVSDLLLKRGNGIDTQEKIFHGDHERQIADWEKEIRPLEVASSQENQRNINSRNLAALEVKERNDTRRLDEAERKNRAAEASRAIRDAAVTAKANGFEISKEGDTIMATHPVTLQRVSLGPSGDMDKRDELILTGGQSQKRAETMAAGQLERANIAAETSTANTIAAGAQTQVDAATQKPVVINPREAVPTQRDVVGGTAIQKVPTGNRKPGEIAPARGDDLARVRSMTARALETIKNDFLVMPKDSKGKPTLNPTIKVASGWGNWDPDRFLPGTPERRAIVFQKNLKDLLTLALIGDMKAQSKTGATGFGQLTGRELDVLESAASRLDWALDEPTLTKELMDIVEKLEKIMLPGEGDPDGVAITPKRKETPAETIKRLGGG